MTNVGERGDDDRPSPHLNADHFSATSLDDAGKPVHAARWRDVVAARGRDPDLRALIQRLRTASQVLDRQEPWYRRDSRTLIAIVAVIVTSFVMAWIMPRGFFVGLLGSGAIAHFALRRRADQRIAGFIARSILEHGLCGQCAYELRGIQADASGLAHCPECGAAWLASRWYKSAPPPSQAQQSNETSPDTATKFREWANLTRLAENVITDDLGLITSTPRSSLSDLPKEVDDSLSPHLRATLVRGLRQQGQATRILMATLVTLLAVVILLTVLEHFVENWSRHGIEQGWTLALVITPVTWLVFFVGIRGGELGVKPRRTARLLVDHRRCGACASDLAAIKPDAYGISHCPICAAGWRIQSPPPAAASPSPDTMTTNASAGDQRSSLASTSGGNDDGSASASCR